MKNQREIFAYPKLPFTPPPRRIGILVFGSGNAEDPDNHIARARVEKALTMGGVDRDNPALLTVFFGCHQPSMDNETLLSEAATMHRYYRELLGPKLELASAVDGTRYEVDDFDRCGLDDRPNSTSATCAIIARDYLAGGYQEVHVVMNWPYVPRLRYLLAKQLKARGISWWQVEEKVHFVSCGGTYLPYVKQMGRSKATLWWMRKVLLREVGAWGKAILDPYSKRLNQNRTA